MSSQYVIHLLHVKRESDSGERHLLAPVERIGERSDRILQCCHPTARRIAPYQPSLSTNEGGRVRLCE
jgi:hypothetical protein